MRRRVLLRFLISCRKVCFPIGVNKIIIEMLEDFDFVLGPLVQVHTLDLAHVGPERAVLTYVE